MTERALVAYIDVDDTLVRSVGSKRIPLPNAVRHVRELFEQGVELYLWSTGGANYARNSAQELGIEHCFKAFLPKPHVIIDDQSVADWRDLLQVQPSSCAGESAVTYRARRGQSGA
jgi:predicted HAD superfamily phosphohydrolase YqeG